MKLSFIKVDNALAAQRDDFKMKLETLNQRKEELERRENQLKETLRMYDKYLREDELKRERATRKIKQETELITLKDKELEELYKQREELEVVIRQQQESIRENMKYKDFLESVVKHSPEEFTEIGDIISRCVASRNSRLFILANHPGSLDYPRIYIEFRDFESIFVPTNHYLCLIRSF